MRECGRSVGDPMTVYVERDVDGVVIDYVRECTTDTWFDLEDVERLMPGKLLSMERVA